MSALMQTLASAGWSEVVQALLHTLWEGAVIALVLFIALKRVVNPVRRHRLCLAALAGILAAGLCTWAVLNSCRTMHRQTAVKSAPSQTPTTEIAASPVAANVNLTPMEAGEMRKTQTTSGNRWIAWLALVWLTGTALMLMRMARSVAGAERLRRSATPLRDEVMLLLIREACGKLGLARRIRVVVTEKLSSPAVAGILLPTLMLPLSLMTTMPPEQLRLIVLHELAHIRRGDYLTNLFQLLAESLLYFNPSVWWISRQLRQEREACCDAMAIALAEGGRLDYARALAEVAERTLNALLAAAPAFADGKDRPGLADRVQRVLVPDYRPDLRLTWRALLGSLFLGGTLLLLSALGTQWTVKAAARLLTPQERMDRIETTMKDLGEAPANFADNPPVEEVEITIQVRTADGSPVPTRSPDCHLTTVTVVRNGAYGGMCQLGSNGLSKMKVKRGDFYIGTFIKGYAPVMLGPLDTRRTNFPQPLELVLDRGFPISIQVLDTDTGKAIPEVTLAYSFWFPRLGSHMGNPLAAVTGDDGIAHLTNCASYAFHVSVQAAGFESGETVFEHLTANENLVVHARRALPIVGHVTEAKTGQPLADATVLLVGVKDAPGINTTYPGTGSAPIAKTDLDGNFSIAQLPRSGRYWLLAQYPGHAGALFTNVQTGQTNLSAALGPEITVRGRIEGDLSALVRGVGLSRGFNAIHQFGNDVSSIAQFVPVRVENGVGYFEYTNLVAGPATVWIGGWRGTTNATTSVDDWVVKIGSETVAPEREVVIRFENASGVAPKGTISLTIPGQIPNTGVGNELEITNGEIHFNVFTGRQLSVSPGHMVGFWFNPVNGVKIIEGPGAQVITVPTIPAGAIYARALDTNGSPVSDAVFSVREIKRSPQVPENAFTLPGQGGIISGEAPRNYVASPLPLGGVYAIVAYRGNNFTASEPVALSETDPDRKVELQFHKGARVEGQVLTPTGEPATNAEVGLACDLLDCLYVLTGARTDESGRFALQDCNPASGKLLIALRSPGLRSVSLRVDFKKLPLTVRLQPGLRLSGQVVDDKGKPLSHAQVTAMSPSDSASVPPEQTFTDDQGQFELNSLSDANYLLLANHQNPGYYLGKPIEVRAGSKKPVVIKVVPSGSGN